MARRNEALRNYKIDFMGGVPYIFLGVRALVEFASKCSHGRLFLSTELCANSSSDGTSFRCYRTSFACSPAVSIYYDATKIYTPILLFPA